MTMINADSYPIYEVAVSNAAVKTVFTFPRVLGGSTADGYVC